ncbi:GNAT family N-acetyltransferase [Aliikangiella sp. IMCC44359]|uniref:GNAT family N-acetyltransferase n=1 Tax=Aliikangiella sp. IMCC44359 TaxID=3459125 RepID=UPI00403B1C0F
MKETITFRSAKKSDIKLLVAMLYNDELGQLRESNSEPLPDTYYSAFEAIEHDPNNQLIVAELNYNVIGMMQITYIPYLTYQGKWRALIEGVRIDNSVRGKGIGKKMFEWGIEQAKLLGCHLVQLTSDKKRPEAIDFYKKLGFVDSHEGMKLHLF